MTPDYWWLDDQIGLFKSIFELGLLTKLGSLWVIGFYTMMLLFDWIWGLFHPCGFGHTFAVWNCLLEDKIGYENVAYENFLPSLKFKFSPKNSNKCMCLLHVIVVNTFILFCLRENFERNQTKLSITKPNIFNNVVFKFMRNQIELNCSHF